MASLINDWKVPGRWRSTAGLDDAKLKNQANVVLGKRAVSLAKRRAQISNEGKHSMLAEQWVVRPALGDETSKRVHRGM